ncbi:MAG: heavy-metal-associated domain-containing protein, partial [Thermomonas sp.]
MKTSVIEVHAMLSVLSVDEVEKRIGEVPGVESVTVNFAAKNATVRYDETRLEVADIKSALRLRAHEPTTPAGPAFDTGPAGHDVDPAPLAAARPAIPAVPVATAAAQATPGATATPSADA